MGFCGLLEPCPQPGTGNSGACCLILVLLVMVGAEWCRALDEGMVFIASTRTVAFPCSLPGVPQLCFWSIMWVGSVGAVGVVRALGVGLLLQALLLTSNSVPFLCHAPQLSLLLDSLPATQPQLTFGIFHTHRFIRNSVISVAVAVLPGVPQCGLCCGTRVFAQMSSLGTSSS